MRGLRADEYPFGRAEGSFFLNGAGAGPLELDPARPPLLAYGANASPLRLQAKLGAEARIAALAGTLRGWAIVHSAHVSPYGAVPATLVRDERAAAAVHVLVLDDDAAAESLDKSEPNYDRVRLTGLELEVDRLGRVDAVDAYISRWGPLYVEGQPVPLGSLPQATLLRVVHTGKRSSGV